MKIEKLFHVLVVGGASVTIGLVGCGSDNSGSGTSANGGSTGAGATGAGAASSEPDGAACSAVCHPSATLASWTDCNGCCCWLPIGTAAPAGESPTCGQEPCCVGRGR